VGIRFVRKDVGRAERENASSGEFIMVDLSTPIKTGTSHNLLWACLEWGLLLLALTAFSFTEVYTPYVTAGVLLLLGSFVTRAIRTHSFLPHTGLEIPWALGIASAGTAMWLAYDQQAALLQFFRLLAAFVLYEALASSQENFLRWPAAAFLAGAAALAIYWPLHNNFAAQPAKLAIINRLGLSLNHLLPAIPGPDIHSNVAAGVLLAALPFGATLIREAWRLRQRLLACLAAWLTSIILAGLVMTSSRGAWLALIVTGALAVLAWIQRRWFTHSRQQFAFWGLFALLGIMMIGLVFLTGSFDRLAGQIPDPNGGIQSRTQLWVQGLSLLRDYPFTGSGLMTHWLVHPVYALLIDAPYIAHAHNTFLEVWIEQGMVGFLGLFLAGIVVAIWTWKALGRREVSIWGWAGLAALTAASLHGLTDVVFYVERTLPVIGLAFGYAWFLNMPTPEFLAQATQTPGRRLPAWIWGALAALLITLIISVVFYRSLAGAWYANQGAVQQTRLELTHYDPQQFDQFTLDQVRQAIDLKPTLESFNRALAADPTNRTALQRRVEIELSLRDYSAALDDTERLWQAGYRDDVTRLLYGDALAANGQIQAAAQTVQGLTWAEPRLLRQAWYRYWLNQDYHRAADAWATVLLLNPKAQDIDAWLKQAQSKVLP
jgi:hypothetical protein